jgi:transcriptional regulator with XRE-family HTH domain
MSIHKRLYDRRIELGMRMQDVATACNLKAWQTVQSWENGLAAPTRARMPLVAKALGVSEDFLRNGYSATELSEKQKAWLSVLTELSESDYQDILAIVSERKEKNQRAIEGVKELLRKLRPIANGSDATLADEERQIMQLILNFSASRPVGKMQIEETAKATKAQADLMKAKVSKKAA